MKKILCILIALAVAFSGSAFEDTNAAGQRVGGSGAASENVVILGSNMGSIGITPPTEIVKVRYGWAPGPLLINDPGLLSGGVVIWDTTSSDGYTISVSTAVTQTALFAGVLVTDIGTADNITVRGRGRNVGYIAIRGYCLASLDDTQATVGGYLNIGNIEGGLRPAFVTDAEATGTSSDIGVLLRDTAASGLMPVWLN